MPPNAEPAPNMLFEAAGVPPVAPAGFPKRPVLDEAGAPLPELFCPKILMEVKVKADERWLPRATRLASVTSQPYATAGASVSALRPFKMDMERQDSWSAVLENHPIFSLPTSAPGTPGKAEFDSLELSTSTLPAFTHASGDDTVLTPSGRRQVMVIRDADVIVAAGTEIRFMSLGEPKLSQSRTKSYKVCHARLHARTSI